MNVEKLANQIKNQCYLHSWIVDSEYRSQAFRLLLPILEEKICLSFTKILEVLKKVHLHDKGKVPLNPSGAKKNYRIKVVTNVRNLLCYLRIFKNELTSFRLF